MSEALKTIYEGLASKNPQLKEYGFDNFSKDMQDENRLKSVYEGLAKKNKQLADYGFDSFKTDVYGQPTQPQEQTDYGPFDKETVEKYPQARQNFERWQQRNNGKLAENANITPEGNEQTGNIPSEPRKKGFWNTYAGDTAEAFAGGSAMVAEWLPRIHNMPYKIAANIIANREGVKPEEKQAIVEAMMYTNPNTFGAEMIGDDLKKKQDNLQKKSDRYGGKDFVTLWKEGDKGSAIGEIFLQATRSLPISIGAGAAALTGAWIPGLAVIGAGTAAKEYDELTNPELKGFDQRSLQEYRDKLNMGEFAKVSNAILSGVGEAGSEMLGTIPVMKWIKATPGAGKIVTKGLKDTASKFFEKFGLLTEPVTEGLEEWANTIWKNIVDKITGIREDWNPLEESGKNFVYGFAGGTQGTGFAYGAKKLLGGQQPATPEQQPFTVGDQATPPVTEEQFNQMSPKDKAILDVTNEINQTLDKNGQVTMIRTGDEKNPREYFVFDPDASQTGIMIVYDPAAPGGKKGIQVGEIMGNPVTMPVEQVIADKIAELDQREAVSKELEQNILDIEGKKYVFMEEDGDNIWFQEVAQDELGNLTPLENQYIRRDKEEFEALLAEKQAQLQQEQVAEDKVTETVTGKAPETPLAPPQPKYPVDKDGQPDIDKMDEAQLFEYNRETFGEETAIADLQGDIQLIADKIAKAEKKLATSDTKTKIKTRLEIKTLNERKQQLEQLIPKQDETAVNAPAEQAVGSEIQGEVQETTAPSDVLADGERADGVSVQSELKELEQFLQDNSIDINAVSGMTRTELMRKYKIGYNKAGRIWDEIVTTLNNKQDEGNENGNVATTEKGVQERTELLGEKPTEQAEEVKSGSETGKKENEVERKKLDINTADEALNYLLGNIENLTNAANSLTNEAANMLKSRLSKLTRGNAEGTEFQKLISNLSLFRRIDEALINRNNQKQESNANTKEKAGETGQEKLLDSSSQNEKPSEIKEAVSASEKPKGITVVYEEDEGQTLIYGTKNNTTRLSVKGESKADIQETLDFEKKMLARAVKEIPEQEEYLRTQMITDVSIAVENALKANRRIIEISKVTIPFLERKLKESPVTTPELTDEQKEELTPAEIKKREKAAKRKAAKLSPQETKEREEVRNRAASIEPINLEQAILQYLVKGGRLNWDEIKREVFPRSQTEVNKRIALLSNKAETIDNLRGILNGLPFEDAANELNVFRNAVLDVILRFDNRQAMAERVLEIGFENQAADTNKEVEYWKAKAEEQALNEQAEIDAIWENVVDNSISENELIELYLDYYESGQENIEREVPGDNQGIVDGNRQIGTGSSQGDGIPATTKEKQTVLTPQDKQITALQNELSELETEKSSIKRKSEKNGLFGDTNDMFGGAGYDYTAGAKRIIEIDKRIAVINKLIPELQQKIEDVKKTAEKENKGQQELVIPETPKKQRTVKPVSKETKIEHAGYEGPKRVTRGNENTLEIEGYGTILTSMFINKLVENGRLPQSALKDRNIQLTERYATELLNKNEDLFPADPNINSKPKSPFLDERLEEIKKEKEIQPEGIKELYSIQLVSKNNNEKGIYLYKPIIKIGDKYYWGDSIKTSSVIKKSDVDVNTVNIVREIPKEYYEANGIKPTKEVPTPSVKPKEAWEMTRGEFYERSPFAFDGMTNKKGQTLTVTQSGDKFTVKIGDLTLVENTDTWSASDAARREVGQDSKIILEKHKQLVQQAISEGKNIPGEVKAEYPELFEEKPVSEDKKEEIQSPGKGEDYDVKLESKEEIKKRFNIDSPEVTFYDLTPAEKKLADSFTNTEIGGSAIAQEKSTGDTYVFRAGTGEGKLIRKGEKGEEQEQVEKIEDFGEKIEGARKDQIKKYFDKINLNGKILSTIFPKPDIKGLLESGLSVKDVAGIKVAYEFAIQDKKKGEKVMKFYAAYAKNILAESINLEYKNEGYVFTDFGKSQIELRTKAYQDVHDKLGADYLALDLTKVSIKEPDKSGRTRYFQGGEPIAASDVNYIVRYYVNTQKYFATLPDAIDYFTEQVKANTKVDEVVYKRKLNIYYDKRVKGEFYIGFPSKGDVIKLKDGFKTSREAFEALKNPEILADLQTMLERILSENRQKSKPAVRLKYSNETARERVGKDWRNGKNIGAKELAETFGFRAIEFGNWVNQKERQVFVNNTYDSLMDLAQLLNISPRSISLAGNLGLTFGSRGSGKAAAHYEPGRKIINLTKTQGLGSLAHEWWHGIDNYFADFKTAMNGMKSASAQEYSPEAREEIKKAFDELAKAVNNYTFKQRAQNLDGTRSVEYFSLPHEMSARAFENYTLNRLAQSGQVNDFIVNYISNEDWNGDANKYPYPIAEESVKIGEAFTNLFDTIEERIEGDNTIMFNMVEDDLDFSLPDTFFSPTEKALTKIQQNKGTAEQFKAMLLKNGAKQAELDWMGWDEFAKANPTMTKADIQEWIDQNKVEVKETQFGKISPRPLKAVSSGTWTYNVVDEETGEVYLRNVSMQVADDYMESGHDGVDSRNPSWQLPGGENYKEWALYVPTIEPFETYDFHHYGDVGEGKVVVWVRGNERTDSEGNRVLFLEEIQSKRAQKGKKEGFREGYKRENLRKNEGLDRTETDRKLFHFIDYVNDNGQVEQSFQILKSKYPAFDEAFEYVATQKVKNENAVPDMPFKQTPQWVNLALRRMMRYAAENGFDRIAWTTGEQQAERYDLSKQVDAIQYGKVGDNYLVSVTDKNGNEIIYNTNMSLREVEDTLGKDIADKMQKGEGTEEKSLQNSTRDLKMLPTLRGDNLKVGGQGMKAFYDAIVPNAAKELGKKFGAKVEETEIPMTKQYEVARNTEDIKKFTKAGYTLTWNGNPITKQRAYEIIERGAQVEATPPQSTPVMSMPITESMRQTALTEGFPMFNVGQKRKSGKTDSKPEIISALNALQSKAPGAAKMVIVQNKMDLLNAIEDITDKAQYDKVKNKEGGVRGLFHKPTDTIFINMEHVGSIDEAISVWVHENGWHKGIRNIVPGNQVDALFEKIYDSVIELAKTNPELQKIVDHVEANYKGKAEQGNEFAAYLAGKIIKQENLLPVEKTLWEQIKDFVKELLAKVFKFNSELLSEKEIINIIQVAVQSNFQKPTRKDYPFLTDFLEAVSDWKNTPVRLNNPNEIPNEFFTKPLRPVILPSLSQTTLDLIGIDEKPILIKGNIFRKNKRAHRELTPEDSRFILQNALYNPNLIGKSQPKKREHYWVAVKLGDKNSVVIIEINPTKTNNEVVGWRYTDEKGLERLKRQATREDGQLLIQTPEGAAAALSTLTTDLSFDKDTNSDNENQINLSVIGETGAANLDKAEEATTRLDNLKVAKEMEQGEMKFSNKAVSDIFTQFVKQERDALENVLYNWSGIELVVDEFDGFINDIKLKGNAGRDSFYSTGENSAAYKPSKKEFIKWLNSEKPFSKEYDVDAEWKANIENLRAIVDKNATKKSFTPKQILLATGWQRGADGRFRYETNDNIQFVKNLPKIVVNGIPKDGKFGDYFFDEETFKAYPEIKDATVVFINSPEQDFSARYDNTSNIFTINYDTVQGTESNRARGLDNANDLASEISEQTKLDIIQDLYHEIQHYIQSVEGFQFGTSSQSQFNRIVEEQKNNEVPTTIEALAKLADRYGVQVVFDISDEKNTEGAIQKIAKAIYAYSMGEVEARNSARRSKLTPEEKRRILLEETENISRKDQIFLENNLGISNNQKPPTNFLDDKLEAIAAKMQASAQRNARIQKMIDDFHAYQKANENTPPQTPPIEPVKPKKTEPISGKEVEKTIVTERTYKGEVKEAIRKKLEEIGLTRNVQSQKEAEEIGLSIIKVSGLENAIEAVREGDVQGAPAGAIFHEKLKSINDKMNSETNPEIYDRLAKEYADITEEMGKIATLYGQYNAFFNYIYQTSDLGFNAEKMIKDYKEVNNGKISAELEEKFKQLEKDFRDVSNKLAEAEKKAKEQADKETIDSIKAAIERDSKRKTKTSEHIRVATDKILATIEKGKIHRPGIFAAASPASLAWDLGLETVKTAIKATGRTIEAIAKGWEAITSTDWYKGLDANTQEQAKVAFNEFFADTEDKADEKGKSDKSSYSITPKGLKIPHSIIRDFIEQGIDNIEELTTAIHSVIIEEYPEITEREVRDAITGYGLTMSQNQDEIEKEIRKMKYLGRVLSGLEDVEEGKRPLRSGLQRDKPDPETRAAYKKLREAMKLLPIDEQLRLDQQKTQLDADKTRLRNQIEDLQREIDKGEQTPQNVRTKQEDEELKELIIARDAKKKEHDAIFKNEDFLNRKRLELSKKAIERRIKELQKRISDGDFAPKQRKELIADTELTRLRAEKLRIQEEYKKEMHKAKLRNRTQAEKIKDGLWDAWGITRALRATGEFSFVGIQGLINTIAHPIQAKEAFKTSMKFLSSQGKADDWMNNLKSQEWYPMLKESKLAITEPNAEITAREELFYSGWTDYVWNSVGKILGRNPELWQNYNPLRAIERAAVGYLDTQRVLRYLDGVEMLKEKGIEFNQANKQAYVEMADVINTFTGRGSIGRLDPELLTKIFFSPRNWSSVIKTATPYAFYHFGKKRAGAEAWKPSVAQKMALADFSKFVGLTSTIVALAALALNGDDDDENKVELDPRSTDFGKIKIGDTRIDPWGGRIQQIVLISRLISDSTKNSYGEVIPVGTPYKSPTKAELLLQMATNKLAPSASMIYRYLSSKVDKDGNRVDTFGEPYSLPGAIKDNLYPIYWETLSELAEDDITALDGLLAFYSFFGGGVMVYGGGDSPEKEFKTEVRRAEVLIEKMDKIRTDKSEAEFNDWVKKNRNKIDNAIDLIEISKTVTVLNKDIKYFDKKGDQVKVEELNGKLIDKFNEAKEKY